MYRYTKSLRILDFIVYLHSNDNVLLEVLTDQFLYPKTEENTSIKNTFRFYIDIENNREDSENVQGEMQYKYDKNADVLHLKYLEGAINVKVDYSQNSVSASVSKRAFPFRAVLGNWILTIPLSELIKTHGLYFIHSACLEHRGRAVLFAGRSRQGKTTISLSLLNIGWNIISDDEAFLCENDYFHAVGVAERSKITFETWDIFKELLGETQKFKGKIIIDLKELFPNRIKEKSIIEAICFIKPSKFNKIKAVKAIDGFERLLSLAYLNSNPELSRENLEFLSRLSKIINCYDLEFNTDFKALHSVLQVLYK